MTGRGADPFSEAKDDLDWYFGGRRDAELGMRGQSYEGSGSGGLSVEDLTDRIHEACVREAYVRIRLDRAPAATVRLLVETFTPRTAGWPIERAARWYDGEDVVAALLVEPGDVMRGARRVALMKPGQALTDLREHAAAALGDALAAFLGRAPRPRREGFPEMPHVPRLKTPPETPRTWMPVAEGRGAWMSPGEHETVRCWTGHVRRHRSRGGRCAPTIVR